MINFHLFIFVLDILSDFISLRLEAHAVLLARRMGVLLLMDESSGRALAETWGIKVRGSF